MSGQPYWNANNIPDQRGKLFVITGANSGLGYEASLALARKGAHVVMACRNLGKGETARKAVLAQIADARLDLEQLDLASLESVRSFAIRFQQQHRKLDVLLNNAGIMAIPESKTIDGFETQFGTNHLGHFALTGLLLDTLLATPASRVVTLSSSAAEMGRIYFDDLMLRHSYERWKAYSQSKLANLIFAVELQRRLETAGADCISVAAHPGFAATNLQYAGLSQGNAVLSYTLTRMFMPLAQSAAMGALPELYATTMPDVKGGEYFGPDGFSQARGYPTRVTPRFNQTWRDPAIARRLWQVSEELTGVHYTALTAVAG
jgi:protochlorophyllide reductase